MKNTFAGGRLTINANAFFYNYKDYRVSQIVDRSALNENYDANMWGAELELAWRPTPRLRINGNVGYLDTRIANGMKSIDVMNRTQGNAEWTVIKPWMQLASNRSEEHKSELQSLLRTPYSVYCLKQNNRHNNIPNS